MKLDSRAGIPTKVTGKLIPIRDNILITDMSFDEQTSKGGIVILSDDGKSEGIRHRWGRVWAIGPEQKDVEVGEWILLEHGRWTRGVTVVEADGTEIVIRRADLKAILMVSKEAPDNSLTYGNHSTVTHATVDPSSFARPSFEQ
jgi:co-chaperonin GroES (HSP10)